MENTCRNCEFWEPSAPVVAKKENYGECNKLSHVESKQDPDYILPVLNNGKVLNDSPEEVEFITGASFGCNQFVSA
jgi:hypothetical protein